jgi:hypothetical protein
MRTQRTSIGSKVLIAYMVISVLFVIIVSIF